MRDFARMHVLLALLRDDGTPLLDYPITPYVRDGVRLAMSALAELQFASGRAQGRSSAISVTALGRCP